MLLDWGIALDCANQPEKALEKLRQAQLLENTAHLHALQGMVLAKNNKPGSALEELNEAIRIDPGYDMSYLYRGNVYVVMKQFDPAEADYRKALSLKPDNPAVHQALAVLARRRSGSP
jgi:Tfp pilus assembly protein PilF